MAKVPARKLNIDYLVIKCGAPAGLVSLGVIGTIRIMPGVGILFFVGNSPPNIGGLDAFEMKLVSAAPNAVRQDLDQLASQNVPPEKLLDEVSRRYRGTIFASDRITKEVPTAITSATSPQQILSQITGAIMQLAKDEKVALSTKRKRRRRRTGRTAVRTRSAKINNRQLGLPQQFELTTLRI